jgi:quercetin dioxygenase-like cupin family protein
MQFGDDPLDAYSVPAEVQPTKLATVITLKVRAKPQKPGRSVTVVWDERSPLLKQFTNRYSYVVRFDKKGDKAANHYHRIKQEMYHAAHGAFKVILEDVVTKEREELRLQAGDNRCIYVPPGVAHVVIAQTNDDVLLVTASHHEATADELPYSVV